MHTCILFLCDCCRLCKSMLIVCMYGYVSDRMAGRLCTWLLRMGIFGRWRSSWTIPRTRRPRSRYEEAVTATYRWNHLRPIVSFIPIYVHTYIHDNFRSLAIWRRRCLPTFSHPYIQVRMSSFTHMYMQTVYVCMYVCMYVCTYFVYTVCVCYEIGVVSV